MTFSTSPRHFSSIKIFISTYSKNKEFIPLLDVIYGNHTNHPVSPCMTVPRCWILESSLCTAFLLRLQSNLHASHCTTYVCVLYTIYGDTLCTSIHNVLSSLLLEAYTSTCANTYNAELAFMHCIDAKFG